MFRVSGPVACYVLKNNNKNIILFGDRHNEREQLCSNCDNKCLYITDLLSKLKAQSDLFIESFIYSQYWYSKRKAQPTDVLGDVKKLFHSHMHTHSGKPKNGIRVHYSDIRSLLNFSPFDNYMTYCLLKFLHGHKEEDIKHLNTLPIIAWCKTIHELNKFIDVMLMSDDYISDVSEIIPREYRKHFTYKHDLMISNRKYVTRLRHQVLKLNPKYQQLLLAFHKDKCKQLKKQHGSYNIAMSNYISKGKLTLENITDITVTLLNWGSHVKDLYTLARMLYYIDRTDNILSYDGAFHSKTYAEFFEKYMKAKIIYEENHVKNKSFLDFFKKQNKKELRCVQLPTKIVNDVFDVA
jgi:hypothetical protein